MSRLINLVILLIFGFFGLGGIIIGTAFVATGSILIGSAVFLLGLIESACSVEYYNKLKRINPE